MELVVVIGIIAVLSGTAVFVSRGIQQRSLNNSSLLLQADMRRAQRMALIEGRRWRILFDTANNRYSVHYVQPVLSPQSERVWIHLPQNVEFRYVPRASVEFLPRGTLGGTAFGVGTGFSMSLRNRQYVQQLTVLPVTGRVEIFEIQRLRN